MCRFLGLFILKNCDVTSKLRGCQTLLESRKSKLLVTKNGGAFFLLKKKGGGETCLVYGQATCNHRIQLVVSGPLDAYKVTDTRQSRIFAHNYAEPRRIKCAWKKKISLPRLNQYESDRSH